MPFLGKCFDKLPDFFQIHFAILKNGQDIEYCHVLRVSVILQKKKTKEVAHNNEYMVKSETFPQTVKVKIMKIKC